MARPVAPEELGGAVAPNGDLIDPLGGRADLEARTLRVLGPEAYESDPLRALRLTRFVAELGFTPDPDTERLTREHAARVAEAAGERVFAELRRLVLAAGVLEGLALADRLGVLRAVLPELTELHGIEQSDYHHLDVYDHTLEVLARQIELEGRLEEVFGTDARRIGAALAEPLGDELTRGQALRFGALLHDIGKPVTRDVRDDGRITFMGHDRVGERMVAGPVPAAAHERALRPLRGRPDAPPPRARLPRARAPARPGRRLPLPAPHLPRGGRGDAAVVRRPARHPRPQVRRGHRRSPRAGA